jgi:outer membrane immunogenic protein
MKKILVIAITCFGFIQTTLASELLKDFDSLGGNSDLYKKAKALNPELSTKVIQKRIVDRRLRLEISPTYTTYWGGNPYISSQSAGMEAQFHINPRWSVDLAYTFSYTNNLTSEGQFLVDKAVIDNDNLVPSVDYAKSAMMGFITYYPFYGKLNMFENVVHFDIYTSLGAGTTALRSGNQTTLGANLGMGIWWSQHLTTRIGYRYQTYEAQLLNGPQQLDMSSGFVSVGYLL